MASKKLHHATILRDTDTQTKYRRIFEQTLTPARYRRMLTKLYYSVVNQGNINAAMFLVNQAQGRALQTTEANVHVERTTTPDTLRAELYARLAELQARRNGQYTLPNGALSDGAENAALGDAADQATAERSGIEAIDVQIVREGSPDGQTTAPNAATLPDNDADNDDDAATDTLVNSDEQYEFPAVGW